MKKTMTLMFCLALLGAGLAFADAGEWTGEVLDLGCYERNGSHGADHASCAVRCLGNDAAMGLLIDGDVVYVDAEGSDAAAIDTLKKLGGKNAKVEGEATEADGKTTVKVTAAEAAGE